jgi:uncharacterized membrane protein YeaQ/YmgE (transglycosylase-associated protein family)
MEISLLGFILLLVLSAIVGVVAMAVVGFRAGGLLAAIGVGFVGGLLGIWMASVFDLPALLTINVGGVAFPLLWALLGAILLVAIISAAFGARGGQTWRRRYGW